MSGIFLFLAALAAPFFLVPIEKVFPIPHIVEELTKYFLVFFILKKTKKNKLLIGIISGVLFTISETILYLPNFIQSGNYSTIPVRLVLTGLLHTVTFSTLTLTTGYFQIGALILNIFVHFLFNRLVGGFSNI